MTQKFHQRRYVPAHSALRAKVERALAANDILQAAALAETAIARGQADPMMLNLAAWRHEEAGDYTTAHRLLQEALALAPGDVLVMAAIGAVLRKEGRLEDALAQLDRVIALEPRHAAAWLERGYVLDALRSTADACESYRQALVLDPNLAPALGKLADAAARDGDTELGRALALRSLAINPSEPSAIFALATIDIEARDGVAAETRLTAPLESALNGDDRTRGLTLLGDALDRQNRTMEAFETWVHAQDNFRSEYAAVLKPNPDRPSHRNFIKAISAQVQAAPLATEPRPSADISGAAATHVFLLGYPRSGTTLVENVLASAPNVAALEERNTLAEIDQALIANDGAMPPLETLDDMLLDQLRAGYWKRVNAMAGDVANKTFIDMNPFNGIKLPIIARLFPSARVLIMRRDPRDVVLSCFRINFTPSPAAWAFSDLVETAHHYVAQMELTDLCLATYPLAFHEVRYDRLVTEFEHTVRKLAEFIGLEWTEAFRTFDRTAQTRGVRTASATQVRRGLYDGRGQWRRYADQLRPVLPILQPWVERFGFEA
jgi:tetratricopeptide (TPR) repeat protein